MMGEKNVTRWTDNEDLGKVEQWKDLFVPAQASVYVLK